MTPEIRQKYLLWLYQNPGQHSIDEPAKVLGLPKTQSAHVARYLISETLAQGETWALIDDSWDGFIEIASTGIKVIENDIPHNEIMRPITNNTVVQGNNSGIINNNTATGLATVSISVFNEQSVLELFQQLESKVREHVIDKSDQDKLADKLDDLKNAYEGNDKPSFLRHYQDFVGSASSHIALFGALAPVAIPALHALASAIS
ncbi:MULTISPECIES: hypothetical protein [unclassified Halomonas]|uniref:hypothetical protein n=1 Tax=unclassified Halomonas TaxID=2609666 RepID=UPI00048040C2|nr:MULTISPECIES: hypothetical protein [unclassified Halomonas]NAO96825.1 hypothetical protein [Halomonas sp. MG34]PKH59833.1 hypothetical protein CXF94_19470 [Halomonas sp. Choline-3u-9]QGQ70326.1 hypothetical protein FDY98_10260 [Halomonas sp. PA16-9]